MRYAGILLTLCITACSLVAQPNPTPPTPGPGPTPTPPGGNSYQGIPTGFDFPADNARLEQLRRDGNAEEMRKHAWNVWAGINQPAVGGGPIWETWYNPARTFQVGAALESSGTIERDFEQPRQKRRPGAAPEAAGDSVLSFVLFNKEARAHIRENDFHMAPTLEALNSSFTAATPLPERKVKDFKRNSVVLKTIWRHVKKTGLTAIPIWDNDPANPDAEGNLPLTWRRIVAVAPPGTPLPPTGFQLVHFLEKDWPGTHVVPLSDFYSVKLDTPQLVTAARRGATQPVELDDDAVLVGMHFTTKEIDDWVWATLWWHDKPNLGKFAENRPVELKAPWRNFLMDIAFDMRTPVESDGQPNACMNPWLEAGFPGGMGSNCMTCHQQSVWPPVEFTVTRGGMDPQDPYFRERTKLDFLWSLADRANP